MKKYKKKLHIYFQINSDNQKIPKNSLNIIFYIYYKFNRLFTQLKNINTKLLFILNYDIVSSSAVNLKHRLKVCYYYLNFYNLYLMKLLTEALMMTKIY